MMKLVTFDCRTGRVTNIRQAPDDTDRGGSFRTPTYSIDWDSEGRGDIQVGDVVGRSSDYTWRRIRDIPGPPVEEEAVSCGT